MATKNTVTVDATGLQETVRTQGHRWDEVNLLIQAVGAVHLSYQGDQVLLRFPLMEEHRPPREIAYRNGETSLVAHQQENGYPLPITQLLAMPGGEFDVVQRGTIAA